MAINPFVIPPPPTANLVSCVLFRVLTGGKTPDVGSRTYTQIMREQMLKGEEVEVRILEATALQQHHANTNSSSLCPQLRKKILEKSKDGSLQRNSGNGEASKSASVLAPPEQRKRGRWDQTVDEQFQPAKKSAGAAGSATPSWTDVEVSDNNSCSLLSFSFQAMLNDYLLLVTIQFRHVLIHTKKIFTFALIGFFSLCV